MVSDNSSFGVANTVDAFNQAPCAQIGLSGGGPAYTIGDFPPYLQLSPYDSNLGQYGTSTTITIKKSGFELDGDLAALFVLLANVGDGEFLECVVLRMESDGKSVEEISDTLGISQESVDVIINGAQDFTREIVSRPISEWASLIGKFRDGDIEDAPEEDEDEEDDVEDESPIDEFTVDGNSWRGVLCVEGIYTGDGRYIQKGALRWDEEYMPQTLLAMFKNPEGGEGHAGAVIAGRIDKLWREDAGDVALIWGEGVYSDDENGQKLKRYVEQRIMRGVSVDLDSLRGEYAEGDADNPYGSLVITGARLRATTACPIPAFIEASITAYNVHENDLALIASGELVASARIDTLVDPGVDGWGLDAVVASGAGHIPVAPPKAWFDKPELPAAIPLQVSPEGRVYGVIADRRAKHIGFPHGDRRGRPVGVPTDGDMKFSFFQNKSVLTAEGVMVTTGVLVDGGTHPLDEYGNPDLYMSADSARAYYSTLDVVADVRLYWDERYGIIAAGAVRPDATPVQIRRLRASDVSPDWRPIDGKREVVGLVTVPVSGFITPEHADQYALVASGGRVGWDFEAGQPLAAVGVSMVRREGFGAELSLAELREEVEELKSVVSRLRRESLSRKIAEL